MKARNVSISFALSIFTSIASANSAYYYGGVCGNQGNWTQQALSRTSELKSFLNQIKDDPNCKALPQALQETYSSIESQIKALQSMPGGAQGAQEDKSMTLPLEIGSLRTFLGSERQMQQQVTQLMASKMVEQSVIQTQNQAQPQRPDAVGQMASRLTSLKERTQKTFSTSLNLLDRAVDAFPQIEQCLVDPNHFGHFIASTIQLLGSFASSGQDATGSQLARTVSKLATYSRDRKFAKALRTLEQNQYMASLSCLLEVTSESYCAARDGKLVFDEMIKNSQLEQTKSGELRLRPTKINYKSAHGQNPLEGYYILTQNIPVITQWLQTVQIGVDPRLPTDADQKNKVLDEYNNFVKAVNDLKGTLNSQAESIREFKTKEEKQNAVFKMLRTLTDMMSNVGSGIPGMNGGQNFFTMAYQPMHIPFKLMGIDTPPEVLGTIPGQPIQFPFTYLEARYQTLPEFKDPEALVKIISSNLQNIIRGAEDSAITYYNKWFIVDKVAIVNKSLVGVLYNVRESLQEIDAYLERLEQRTQQYHRDQSINLGIRDTRNRIDKVLAEFRKLESIGSEQVGEKEKNLQSAKRFLKDVFGMESKSTEEETLAAAEEFIRVVYEQFYVMLAKSGWLANRMSDFVNYDYNLMQRSGVNFSPFMNEIYLATGRALVDNIISMSAGNPASVNQDLAMALRLNKGNLEALEMGLAESYLDQIAFLQHIASGKTRVDGGSLWVAKNAHRQLFKVDEIPGKNNNLVWRTAKGAWYTLGAGGTWSLWGSMWTSPVKISPDDEFGSAKRVRDQFCAQTLAFNNLEPFWGLCKDTVLLSPYAETPAFGIDPKLLDSISLAYKAKAWENYQENKALNHSKRICGLRDYSRKNLVLYLLQGQTRN